MSFNKNELLLWKNTLDDIQQQIEDCGDEVPAWMYLEEGRTKGMIRTLKTEAFNDGWTVEDLLDLEIDRLGGKN